MKLKRLPIVLSSVSLVSCTAVSQPPTPPPPQAGVCRTIHGGSELSLNRPLQTIRVPVSRESATEGFTTLILPTSAEKMSIQLLIGDNSGWSILPKNQVVVWQDANTLDFSPNLRIIKGDRKILVLNLPVNHFTLTVQPVVNPESQVAGTTQAYPVTLSATGITSPFQFLENSFTPGKSFPASVNSILNRTQPGDLLIPNRFAHELTLSEITGAELNLCPRSH